MTATPETADPRAAKDESAASAAAIDTSRLTHLVGYAASRASIQLKKPFRKHLGPLQLKAVEFSLLVLVAANPGLNQKRLGAALDLSAPNLAVILDRLAERGLVERVRSTVDRRAQELRLTPAGRALTARAEAIAATMETEALRVLSAAERALLIELLLKVARGRPPRR
ncbi:MAG TPA: MarR family transcriptional regulator [Burkholderiaceae bacterium]|nr:MarR family transcriptional regulator [Burkholderiaceae bacterium]